MIGLFSSLKTSSVSISILFFKAAGVDSKEVPPVPIPNTEVKLTSADNTCLETDREDRSMPTQGIRSGESLA